MTGRATAGTTSASRAPAAPCTWRADTPDHGRRPTCRTCGREQWQHEVPKPREAT